MERRFVTVNGRQVHYAHAGRGLPVVLLHASPGDWRPLRGLAAELARSFAVYALDTPGHGGSDPLPAPDPGMADYGAALGETLTALGLERAHLYGTHTGAKIALSLAAERPELVASLVLDGVGVSTPEERADQLARYLPPVRPRSDGGHLVAAWHQVRNMFLYWPWYDERAASRLTAAPPPAPYLHDLTAGLLEAGANYPLAYRAAFTCDPLPLLARLTVPALVLASSADPLHAHLERLPAHRLQVESTTSGISALASRIRAHLTSHTPSPATAGPHSATPPSDAAPSGAAPSDATPSGTAPCGAALSGAARCGTVEPGAAGLGRGVSRRYVPTRLGQVLVRQAGAAAGSGRPLVILPPAPASGRAVTDLLAEAARHRPAFALDLPGTGGSDLIGSGAGDDLRGTGGSGLVGSGAGDDLPGTGGSGLGGGGMVEVIALAVGDALDGLGLDGVDLYGTGAGAVVAVAVARSRPGLVRALALAGLPDPGVLTEDEARARTPGLEPDEHGTHLLRAWHLVRDGGLATGLPELPGGRPDLAELHARVLDLAASWRTYAAAFRAAARPAGEPPVPVVAADPVWDPFTARAVRAAPGHDGTGGVASLLKALEDVTG
ncbi:alpha/beta fold hydrolase [Nonomuraea sp. MCN248]|uniref:Alpha/beta fold hydrolase n=1 Tax=Nonomuraea corallina TaxID=2989783 RepID=A0ABT4SBY4_9ACTN|nr:alpha/beta fold hydrolase [Nonomuraea corallina]MDA0634694.1 alpha/beta fold hydrolase [Nonomuraea corallina]